MMPAPSDYVEKNGHIPSANPWQKKKLSSGTQLYGIVKQAVSCTA